MDYQSYDDYMRSVLGYQTGNNIYANTYSPRNDYYYDMPTMMTSTYNTNDTERLNEFYPQIYKLIYPMVCKVCSQNANREITKELVDRMTDEIYINFESDDRQTQPVRQPLKNGDVRNPNAKEPEVRQENRQNNFLLRDLIRILILRELLKPGNRPPFGPGSGGRPPMPPPPRPPVMRPY